VSFLPFSEHSYRQAPYQECTEAEYKAFLEKMPKSIDWTSLQQIEHTDSTNGSQQLACVAGSCEL
jgi:ribonucleoside-diphosphate reductase alpha chain